MGKLGKATLVTVKDQISDNNRDEVTDFCEWR